MLNAGTCPERWHQQKVNCNSLSQLRLGKYCQNNRQSPHESAEAMHEVNEKSSIVA